MKMLVICLTIVLAPLGKAAGLNSTGAIVGTLTGDGGVSIAAGIVTLQLQPPYPKSRFLQTVWDVQSGSDGSFRFDQLNDGTYRLCAQVPKSAWLNPCQWGLQAPIVTLSTANPSATVAVALKTGAVVPIRVDDPGQLLTHYEGTVPGAHLLIGIGTDARVFMPAAVISQDSGGRNQQVVVPFNSAVKLVVFSSQFQLSSSGIPLPRASSTIPIGVPSGQTPPTIVLQVTGRSAP
ncbi:MAG TPA: hypothetical protein VH640_18145 [Bryobacteraceae bacterium]